MKLRKVFSASIILKCTIRPSLGQGGGYSLYLDCALTNALCLHYLGNVMVAKNLHWLEYCIGFPNSVEQWIN